MTNVEPLGYAVLRSKDGRPYSLAYRVDSLDRENADELLGIFGNGLQPEYVDQIVALVPVSDIELDPRDGYRLNPTHDTPPSTHPLLESK